jgi:hypothetical protein
MRSRFHWGEIYICNSEAYFTGVPSGYSTRVKSSKAI